MIFFGVIFFIIGSTGLVLSTFGSAVVAAVLSSLFRKRECAPESAMEQPQRIEVLIAAHNEAPVIRATLESIMSAATAIKPRAFNVNVTVCCDHCTDGTFAEVEKFAEACPFPVRAVTNPGKRGKWNVLNFLVRQSQGDWVALVDAAAIWDARLLASICPMLLDASVIGVAPSYSPQNSGLLERCNWRLEQFLKRFENRAGGPVSVHGASVFYRREALLPALVDLNGMEWLNDDVAIPLTLRLREPKRRIIYFSEGVKTAWVSDVGVRGELVLEYRRRRRMLIGNLQWVKLILLPRWSRDVLITAIASRRCFRMLWAYWVLFLGAGSISILAEFARDRMVVQQTLHILAVCLAGILSAFCVLIASNWARRLLMAFVSGLQLPWRWRQLDKNRGVAWL